MISAIRNPIMTSGVRLGHSFVRRRLMFPADRSKGSCRLDSALASGAAFYPRTWSAIPPFVKKRGSKAHSHALGNKNSYKAAGTVGVHRRRAVPNPSSPVIV